MSHPILERHIDRRGLKVLYLFYGDEEFLMQRAVQRLEAAIAVQAGEPPSRLVREARETTLADFLGEAREATLWGPGQLLILRGVQSYPPDELKAILGYLDRPAARTWMVLLAEGLKARDLERHPVWSRLLKNEAALGFFRLKEGDLYQWLTREARGLGKSLSMAAAQRLVEMVGDNLAELHQELEKLALYAGAEANLTPGLVSQLASHSRAYNIFALTDALGESGATQRLRALDHLLDLGEKDAKILTMLARQIRLLLRVKEAKGPLPPEQARALNLGPWQMKKLINQAGRFSEAALRSHLLTLHRADQQLKTSSGPPRLWLEWILLKMGPG